MVEYKALHHCRHGPCRLRDTMASLAGIIAVSPTLGTMSRSQRTVWVFVSCWFRVRCEAWVCVVCMW